MNRKIASLIASHEVTKMYDESNSFKHKDVSLKFTIDTLTLLIAEIRLMMEEENFPCMEELLPLNDYTVDERNTIDNKMRVRLVYTRIIDLLEGEIKEIKVTSLI